MREPTEGEPERPERRYAIRVKCRSSKEAALIERGLQDPEVLALVKIMGALSNLPDAKTKMMALEIVDRILQNQKDRQKD